MVKGCYILKAKTNLVSHEVSEKHNMAAVYTHAMTPHRVCNFIHYRHPVKRRI